VKVTRIAYSRNLNAGKYAQLIEQARRLGRVRSLVWDLRGSIAGLGVSDRAIRDTWMAEGTAAGFGVLANAWKEAAALNVLDRDTDPDIGLYTSHTKVWQIIQERADRHRSRLPDQDSNTTDHCRCGERNIPTSDQH
jgi:hypothetical protein